MTRLLVRAHGNNGADRAPAKPISDAPIAVSLVAGDGGRASARRPERLRNTHRFHEGFELRRLVTLSRRHFDGKWQAVTVSDQVEFGPESAARAAQRVVFGLFRPPFSPAPAADRLARTLLPSTHHMSQSMRPSASSRICKASKMRSHVPSLLHRFDQSYTVCHGPKRSGRSRQGAPVRTIQRMPSTIVRRSLRGRPVDFSAGIMGSMIDHCSSVSACRFMTSPSMARVSTHGRDIGTSKLANTEFSDRT